jgi:N-acylneuraminate cytidylyltransferase
MIKSEYINQGIDKLLSENLHSVFSVTKEHWLPRWNERVEPIEWEIDKRPRRQDKEASYIENGMFYITRKNILTQNKLRYGGKMGFIEIPLYDSFQVDSQEDLELIRKII